MNRREALAHIALITGGAFASGFAQAALRGAALHRSPTRSALTADQQTMVEQLAELVIPRTDTPGAIDAGVPAFIDQIVSAWYTPVERGIFLDGLVSLDAFCRKEWGKSFLSSEPPQQTRALMQAEESGRSYEPGVPLPRIRQEADEHAPFFYKLKLLVVLGYYTSEVGATQELRYTPVPGRYEGDVDFEKAGGHQWSF